MPGIIRSCMVLIALAEELGWQRFGASQVVGPWACVGRVARGARLIGTVTDRVVCDCLAATCAGGSIEVRAG